mmetsp:Transcript_4946/g.11426  ORF Transcript_4946/g.11426 Transcript_4946/m.11426 type:complete len:203 (-) Transcript_4946:270-878(-)
MTELDPNLALHDQEQSCQQEMRIPIRRRWKQVVAARRQTLLHRHRACLRCRHQGPPLASCPVELSLFWTFCDRTSCKPRKWRQQCKSGVRRPERLPRSGLTRLALLRLLSQRCLTPSQPLSMRWHPWAVLPCSAQLCSTCSRLLVGSTESVRSILRSRSRFVRTPHPCSPVSSCKWRSTGPRSRPSKLRSNYASSDWVRWRH